MKKDLKRTIDLPEGYEFSIDGNEVKVKANEKENSKSFDFGRVNISKEGNKIVIFANQATRRESRMIGTIEANILNLIKGLGQDFIYKMEICNVHFPMNVKAESDKLVIKSFLGEKVDRYADIVQGVKVDIKGSEITISSPNRDNAGQTAANIEKATKPKGRDRRIFQDGIFIKEKCGRII